MNFIKLHTTSTDLNVMRDRYYRLGRYQREKKYSTISLKFLEIDKPVALEMNRWINRLDVNIILLENLILTTIGLLILLEQKETVRNMC